MLKAAIKKVFRKMGYEIVPQGALKKAPVKDSTFTMGAALKRCRERGTAVSTVVDVGASNGIWSKRCMQTYPDAAYLLIEAQEPHRNDLEKYAAGNKNVNVVMAAAGSREGKIYFDNGDLFGGLASETPLEKNCIEVPVTTIDNEVRRLGLKPPFLVKLDTHGFEVPILEGAAETLKNASLVIIETYNYQLTANSLRYWEMNSYMEKLGFLPVEMVDFMLREKDKTFWQMDTFYIPASSANFSSNSYR
jgi:FkbM family methyltransferase